MAFYCMGTLTSCSKSNVTPAAAAGTLNITLDLTSTAYSTLTTVGNYAYSGNVLVAHVKDGSYVALSKICTHEGTTVSYRSASNDVYCADHGSVFTTTGSVTKGPAPTALTQYKVTLSTDSKSLTIN